MTAEAPHSDTREFWSSYQPGLRFATAPVGSRAFFDEVSAYRYALEPHIADVVQFPRWSRCDVLEAGCGIGTDGAQFASVGACYTGIDFSNPALELARRRFALYDLPGRFTAGSVTHLPFRSQAFDLVFSHGVIHHVPDTEATVREFARVLRPGATAIVMLYHRRSFNYYAGVMMLRRALVGLLVLPGGPTIVSRITGEPEDVLVGHRELLRKHGIHYLLDRELFLSNNTDGPSNPLSKVYTRQEAHALFAPYFRSVTTQVRYLNLRLYAGGERFARSHVGNLLERRVGWHLYVEARKGD